MPGHNAVVSRHWEAFGCLEYQVVEKVARNDWDVPAKGRLRLSRC